MSNLQQFLHIGEDTARRVEIIDRETEARRALEERVAQMTLLLRKIGQAADKFRSRPDDTPIIVMDYGAQCGEFGLWERYATVGDLREAERLGGGHG